VTFKFFDKRLGRGVPLEDFPGLFAMQAHTGLFGVLFTTFWFLIVSFFLPTFWNNGGVPLAILASTIVLAFLFLSFTSSLLSNYLADRLIRWDLNSPDKSRMDVRVRVWMTLLSASYVFVICCLIWLTGGATSPFISFYVMTFTLTISRSSLPYPGLFVLLYFLAAILFACFAYEIWQSPITAADITTIQQSRFQYFVLVFFIGAALIVPTLSAYFIEKNAQSRKIRRHN
jgi:MFS family permease